MFLIVFFNQPCSDTYEGAAPNSAPEVQLIADLLAQYKINLYLAIHSYGSYLLFPWGYDYIYHDNHAEFLALGNKVAAAIASHRGTTYSVGNGAFLLYPATGASDDYAAGAAGIPYSFTIELPSSGNSGFELPVSQIQPVVEETFLGFQAFAQFLIADAKK